MSNTMTLKGFTEYMKENLTGYQHFYEKALEFQSAKNAKRQKDKRWNEVKIERAVNDMWANSMQVLYNQIKPQVRKDEKIWGKKAWFNYMKEKELFETLNESLAEIEFGEE